MFIANEAGALEMARHLHLLQPITLPTVATTIPTKLRTPANNWIGLSGRIWIMVYHINMVDPSNHSLSIGSGHTLMKREAGHSYCQS